MRRYIDIGQWNGECVSVFVRGMEICWAGNRVCSMPVRCKNEEYRRLAEEYDIHFIFDDHVPTLDFYTVPYVEIMAEDSLGGYIGTVGEMAGLDSLAPVCYISRERSCCLIGENIREWLERLDSWREGWTRTQDVAVFRSKEEAEAAYAFISWEELGLL